MRHAPARNHVSCGNQVSTIGGPGGVGGPKGPGGVDHTDDVGGADEVAGGERAEGAERAAGAAPTRFDGIAADIAAGKLTPHEAVERMVDEIAGHQDLAAADRAELRELLADLVANDPYLASLIGQI
jgi:hypothetical protein